MWGNIFFSYQWEMDRKKASSQQGTIDTRIDTAIWSKAGKSLWKKSKAVVCSKKYKEGR